MLYKTILGEILIQKGLVTRSQVLEALKQQKQVRGGSELPESLSRTLLVSEARNRDEVDDGSRLGRLLVEQGLVTPEQVKQAIDEQAHVVKFFSSLDASKLATVLEIGIVVGSTLNLAEVLRLIMEFAAQVTDAEASTLMLKDESTGDLVFSVPTGPKSAELTDVRIPAGEGIAGWVAEKETSSLVTDVTQDPRFYQRVDRQTGFVTKSILAVPLKFSFKLIGVLEVINKKGGSVFTPEDELFLNVFGCIAGMAIENARLYRELQSRMAHDLNMQRKLAEAEKLRALGLMASGIAHNFNNTLTVILGNSELLEQSLLDPATAERVGLIKRASMNGAEIVERLLTFTKSRDHGDNFEMLSLNQMALASIRVTEPIWQAKAQHMGVNIEIKHNLSSDDLVIQGNEDSLKEVLINVIFNAIDAMPQGGRIDVTTRQVGAEAQLIISDEGEGLSREEQKRIFDPFYSTKSPPHTGLGLSLAFGVINSHNGGIEVESDPGQGASFIISLPMGHRDKTLSVPPSQASSKRAEARILVIDDEDAIVQFVCEVLDRFGHQVTGAGNGGEGIRFLESGEYDLLITDLAMPDISGWEVVEKAHEIAPGMKIGLMTGWSVSDEELSKRGVDFILNKPFSMKRILEIVDQLLSS